MGVPRSAGRWAILQLLCTHTIRKWQEELLKKQNLKKRPNAAGCISIFLFNCWFIPTWSIFQTEPGGTLGCGIIPNQILLIQIRKSVCIVALHSWRWRSRCVRCNLVHAVWHCNSFIHYIGMRWYEMAFANMCCISLQRHAHASILQIEFSK